MRRQALALEVGRRAGGARSPRRAAATRARGGPAGRRARAIIRARTRIDRRRAARTLDAADAQPASARGRAVGARADARGRRARATRSLGARRAACRRGASTVLAPRLGQRAAEVEDRDAVAADRGARRRRGGRARRATRGGPVSTTTRGLDARAARAPARPGRASTRERQRAQAARGAARARAPARAAPSTSPGALASKIEDALVARRGGRDALGRGEPARSPSARRSRTRAAGRRRRRERLDAGEQDLLDGALDRADGEALLEDAVGLVLVEAAEARSAGARARPGRRRARGRRDRRGDVVRLLEGGAQRLDLGRGRTAGGRRRCGAARGSRSAAPRSAACSG